MIATIAETQRRAQRLMHGGARPVLQAVAVIVLVSGPAQGADALDALGPERIGARFEDVAREIPLQCGDEAARRICAVASDRIDFEGVPVIRVEALFEATRLQQVRVVTGIEHYKPLLGKLTARYGAGEDRSYQAIAGMSGDFAAGVSVWREAAVSVVLEQYAGKIDRSALTYGSARAMEELLRKTSDYPRGARRDL